MNAAHSCVSALHSRICAFFAFSAGLVAVACWASVSGQGRDGFVESFDHPTIDYYDGALTDDATALARSVGASATRLAFEPGSGYLKSVLDALQVPIESQVVVFSQTSLQGPLINEKNPRAVYVNDRLAVSWVRGGDVVEIRAESIREPTVRRSRCKSDRCPENPGVRRADDDRRPVDAQG